MAWLLLVLAWVGFYLFTEFDQKSLKEVIEVVKHEEIRKIMWDGKKKYSILVPTSTGELELKTIYVRDASFVEDASEYATVVCHANKQGTCLKAIFHVRPRAPEIVGGTWRTYGAGRSVRSGRISVID